MSEEVNTFNIVTNTEEKQPKNDQADNIIICINE